MDLNTITSYRPARQRGDLRLAPGERVMGGGTWLFSEPQLDITGLVDLTTMGWPALEYPEAGGLRIAATCTIAQLAQLPPRDGWMAQPIFYQCASALLASPKIWNVATVGGNVCRSFAAAGMVSLCVALDGVAVVWSADGTQFQLPVSELITGNGSNRLRPGDVLRALDIPEHALRARAGYRKIALAELGRSGAVLTGRVDPATGGDDARGAVFTITAATLRPTVLRYPTLPSAEQLRSDVDAAGGYYSDPLGSADWRRQVSGVLLEEIRTELSRPART
ncbi:FAD binding domain-containing protein [Jatrophihabitans sp.]|uniref:FAD binding domain-containing protein n=1 Tax=Jatrophihabitans sp. TaxID=1932789 RepID=UPI0030C6E0BA|nr:putative molybdopterin dehydrogenase, FAD-binding subunit [Jatrophihabitans sp.]